MQRPTELPADARGILDLARRDRAAARAALARLTPEAQLAAVAASPLARRAELLELCPQPEALIPELPPAELVFIARAVGVADAGWLLEHATPDQLLACFDLDAWRRDAPDPQRLRAWLDALAEAGDETLLRAAQAVDLELLVIELGARARVVQHTGGDDWSPPDGGLSLDGQFFIVPTGEGDDLEDLLALLRVLFESDYWSYFRLLSGVIWEERLELTDYARRWRDGRLQDLGFPDPDEARRIYSWLRPEARDALAERPPAAAPEEWPLPVFMPRLPTGADAENALFRAIAALPAEERRPHLFAFLSLANQIAVADELPLGDADSLPAAIEKGARLAARGLVHLARVHDLPEREVLRRTPVERLFQVGFQLAREEGSERPPAFQDDEAEDGSGADDADPGAGA